MGAQGFDAVVLAGGSGRRLGGTAKPQVLLDGVSLLDRVLAAVSGARRVVVAGPRQPAAVPVTWVHEDPPGGGPVAGLAAALPEITAPVVVVLAADLPAVAPAVPRLLSALAGDDGRPVAMLADGDGRVNHLAAAWRRDALEAALGRLGRVDGAAAKHLLAGLDPALVPDTGGWGTDCDTWEDVRDAREALASPHHPVEEVTRAMTNPLDTWLAELAAALDVDPAIVDRNLLLDVARDAAHGIARPAAPLTTFLVGYAAGMHGGGADAVRRAAETTQREVAVRTTDSAGPAES